MLLNMFPNNVYFGDSGCFIIACLLDIFLIKLILTKNLEVFYFLIPFALPIFDVFCNNKEINFRREINK